MYTSLPRHRYICTTVLLGKYTVSTVLEYNNNKYISRVSTALFIFCCLIKKLRSTQIVSIEQGFQHCILIRVHRAAFTPVLPTRFIKFLPSFTQTSLEALFHVNPGWDGLTLSFLWPFSVIPE